jgi:ABC-2 type transport system permease protein
MISLRGEWLKLRSTRAPWLLLLAAVALVVAGVSGAAKSGSDLALPATVSKAAEHVGLVSMLSLVLGILVVAGEYRHRTITDTFLSTPRRSPVIVAKLAVSMALGLVYGVVSAGVALLTIALWWKGKGIPLDLWDGDLWRTLLGGVAWNIAFAAIGVGLGSLVRNLTAAIALALVWIAVVEGVVGQLVGDLARWLPFASGTALGRGPTLGSYSPVSQWQGALSLVVCATVLVTVALSTSVRSDVS